MSYYLWNGLKSEYLAEAQVMRETEMELLVFVDMYAWDSSNTKELQTAFFPGKELQIKLLYS